MIASLLSIKIHVHMIDNSNNEIRGNGVTNDAGEDEKQLIKFALPYVWAALPSKKREARSSSQQLDVHSVHTASLKLI